MADDPKASKNVVVHKKKFSLSKGGQKATNAAIEELKAKQAAGAPPPEAGGAWGAEAMPGATSKPKPPVEDGILALFPVGSVPDSPLLARFWAELAPRITLPETSLAILEAFSNIDITAGRLAQSLDRNSYYADQFRRFVISKGSREETPSLEAAVVLVGMTHSRDLILAMQMQRTLKGGHPEWKAIPPQKVLTLQLKPGEMLKYALKTEEPLLAQKSPYADAAFAAGMLFDWLAYLAQLQARTDVVKWIDLNYAHGAKIAESAMKKAASVPELAGSKWVYSACLLHDIGKVVFALLEPTYISFHELCVKSRMPRDVRFFAERERFGLDHALLGALAATLFGVLEPVGPALRHHHRAFLVKSQPGGHYSLAKLIEDAHAVALPG